MQAIYLTAFNLLLCIFWGGGAFMRLRACHSGVLFRIRMIYVGMIVAATSSGFRFQLFGEYAGWADLTVSGVMVGFILLGSQRWRYGVPGDLLKHFRRIV